MPRIVSSNGSSNIAAIRSYFCREGTIRDIANATGMDYDTLINGTYKILLEPIAYFKYNSVMFAMTATEANRYVIRNCRAPRVDFNRRNPMTRSPNHRFGNIRENAGGADWKDYIKALRLFFVKAPQCGLR